MAPRTYANDVTLSIGPLTTRGRLIGVKNSAAEDPGFKLCSPNGEPVEKRYVDAAGKVYEYGELGRAYVDDEGNLVPVDPEAIKEAKKSTLPLNVINITVHPRDSVDRYLYPSGKHQGYIFEPKYKDSKNKLVVEPNNMATYDVICAAIAGSNHAFVAKANIQNNEALFRLSMYQGAVVVQRQLVPSELHQFDITHSPVRAAVKRKVVAMVSNVVEEFSFDTYTNDVTERLLAARESGFDLSTIESTSKPAEIDFEAALDAFLK